MIGATGNGEPTTIPAAWPMTGCWRWPWMGPAGYGSAPGKEGSAATIRTGGSGVPSPSNPASTKGSSRPWRCRDRRSGAGLSPATWPVMTAPPIPGGGRRASAGWPATRSGAWPWMPPAMRSGVPPVAGGCTSMMDGPGAGKPFPPRKEDRALTSPASSWRGTRCCAEPGAGESVSGLRRSRGGKLGPPPTSPATTAWWPSPRTPTANSSGLDRKAAEPAVSIPPVENGILIPRITAGCLTTSSMPSPSGPPNLPSGWGPMLGS